MSHTILLVTAIVLCIAAALSIGIAGRRIILDRKAGNRSTVLRTVGKVMMAIILAVVIVANFAALQFSNIVDQYFASINLKDPHIQSVRQHSAQVAKKITDEGIVLLKNNNQALPLQDKAVNVFGYSSIDINFGGTGSGSGNDAYNTGFYQGLDKAGIAYNTQLKSFYEKAYTAKAKQNALVMVGGDYNNYEPAKSAYSNELIDQAKKFSKTALIVLTRNGGEGGDLPLDTAQFAGGKSGEHYLQLNANERDMVSMVEKNFEHVVVIINSSNAMELGFLNDEGIDAALWIGGPGTAGVNSLCEILQGKTNPSGRLADTYAYDVKSNPSYYNFGKFLYTNTTNKYKLIFENPGVFNGKHYAFADYAEGIYVGYRYYETRWVNNQTGEVDEQAYRAAVQYPFGYGLSYTDFTQKISAFTNDTAKKTVHVQVTVTNTGKVAGKDAVQLYFTPPYYAGGIEKSHINLIDYAKTKLLEPGKSQTLTFTLPYEDMASYDYQTNRSYVLEHGTYQIKLMNNAHDELDSRTIDIAKDTIYNKAHDGARSSDQTVATNQFDDVSHGNNVTYLSRNNWEGTTPTERTQDKEATPELIKEIEHQGLTQQQQQAQAKDIVTAKHQLKLADMKGLPYDDPKWEQLLEQLNVNDMKTLIANGGYATVALKSIDKKATSDQDGPQGVNSLISQDVRGVTFPSEVVVASTFNKNLAQEEGKALAQEAAAYGISGLYGPAMNTHRSPFGGRNYEYYSEDPVLAGYTAAGFVKGANAEGIYTYMKHFALDEQETERLDISIWANEQAMREIYFKPFELCVKQGKVTAAMASDSFIGGTWAGARSELMNTVLRDEWGFRGMVITDFVTSNSKDADRALRSGTDLSLTTLNNLTPTELTTESAAGRQAMRTAAHNILYTVANSNAQNITKTPFPWWTLGVVALDIVAITLFLLVAGRKARPKSRVTVQSAAQ